MIDGAIRFSGPDARTFLQGQLTQDVELVAAGQPLLAAHCTPQGRVIALMQLEADGDDLLARLPASMADTLIAKLRRFVLRAKVTMTNVSGEQPRPASNENELRLNEIAAGLPQVYPETTEAFVPQMLNLDVLGGISFNKGCYTGQEIVARAHFRGQVKRRMQRFRTLEPYGLAAGDEGRLLDGRPFQVVQAARLADGRCDFLAVTPILSGASPAENASAGEQTTLPAEVLPLPYSFPSPTNA